MIKEKLGLIHYYLHIFFNECILKNIYQPKICSIEETIKVIINENASISRYGDGELMIMQGKDIHYQKNNHELSNKMQQILKEENKKDFLVCLPDIFSESAKNQRTEQNLKFWNKHMSSYRDVWYSLINMQKQYYNATCSRFWIPFKDKTQSKKIAELWKKVWNEKDIIIVEGIGSRLGVGNDLFDCTSSISRIICPSENAYDIYDQIITYIVDNVSQDKLILIALGPTATVLAYDLYKLKYQAIDVGHIDLEYSWMKMNSYVQVPIDGKYCNEADGGDSMTKCSDSEYLKQILCVLGGNKNE